MSSAVWLPAALVFVAVLLGTIALALISELVRGWLRSREVAKRLRPVLLGQTRRGGDIDALVRNGEGAKSPFSAVFRVVPGLKGLETLLDQARLDWGIQTFFILMVGLGVGFGASAFLITKSTAWSVLLAGVASLAPYLYASLKRSARLKRFEEEFPQSIDFITRAIRAGHPLSSSIGLVAEEGPPIVAEEFRQVFEEQRFGIPFEEALLGMVDRVDLIDVRIFAIAVLVQREVGGNLAETLENLGTTIRRRFYLRRQLRVYTAQGRMTGATLAAMPPVVGLVIFLLNPGFTETLFGSPAGRIMVGIALGLQLFGMLWIRKIMDIDI
jgi:tight adherence protein B